MAQKRIEDLFKEIALKHDLPAYVVEEIYNSQYRKLKMEIKSLEFKSIKLPAWGKYIPSKKKLAWKDFSEKKARLRLKKMVKQINENNDGETEGY
jgi:hypothetical protein